MALFLGKFVWTKAWSVSIFQSIIPFLAFDSLFEPERCALSDEISITRNCIDCDDRSWVNARAQRAQICAQIPNVNFLKIWLWEILLNFQIRTWCWYPGQNCSKSCECVAQIWIWRKVTGLPWVYNAKITLHRARSSGPTLKSNIKLQMYTHWHCTLLFLK